MPDILVVKKSPIVIVRNFIGVQALVSGAYFLSAFFVYYAQIWRGLPIADYVPFQIAQGIFIFGTEVILLMSFFFSWYRQTVRLTSDQLIFAQGILSRHHTIVARASIASASFRQSVLGRLTHYGTILINDAKGSVLLKLAGMSEPEHLVQALMTNGHATTTPVTTTNPQLLLQTGEHEQLERKSTFRWDLAGAKVNKALERATLKTVAAFLNTGGGNVLLGVADDGQAVGMEHDYATLARKDMDGFENHFNNVFNTHLGAHVRHLVRLEPFEHQGKPCVQLVVAPSPRPVYLNDEGKEEFFIRTGNTTTSLKLSEAAAYIESHYQPSKH